MLICGLVPLLWVLSTWQPVEAEQPLSVMFLMAEGRKTLECLTSTFRCLNMEVRSLSLWFIGLNVSDGPIPPQWDRRVWFHYMVGKLRAKNIWWAVLMSTCYFCFFFTQLLLQHTTCTWKIHIYVVPRLSFILSWAFAASGLWGSFCSGILMQMHIQCQVGAAFGWWGMGTDSSN